MKKKEGMEERRERRVKARPSVVEGSIPETDVVTVLGRLRETTGTLMNT